MKREYDKPEMIVANFTADAIRTSGISSGEDEFGMFDPNIYFKGTSV